MALSCVAELLAQAVLRGGGPLSSPFAPLFPPGQPPRENEEAKDRYHHCCFSAAAPRGRDWKIHAAWVSVRGDEVFAAWTIPVGHPVDPLEDVGGLDADRSSEAVERVSCDV